MEKYYNSNSNNNKKKNEKKDVQEKHTEVMVETVQPLIDRLMAYFFCSSFQRKVLDSSGRVLRKKRENVLLLLTGKGDNKARTQNMRNNLKKKT